MINKYVSTWIAFLGCTPQPGMCGWQLVSLMLHSDVLVKDAICFFLLLLLKVFVGSKLQLYEICPCSFSWMPFYLRALPCKIPFLYLF